MRLTVQLTKSQVQLSDVIENHYNILEICPSNTDLDLLQICFPGVNILRDNCISQVDRFWFSTADLNENMKEATSKSIFSRTILKFFLLLVEKYTVICVIRSAMKCSVCTGFVPENCAICKLRWNNTGINAEKSDCVKRGNEPQYFGYAGWGDQVNWDWKSLL